MTILENVVLAPYTTFRIGGKARYFAEAHAVEDIYAAIAFAREHRVSLRVIGAGSNLLVPDEGVNALVVRMCMQTVEIHDDLLIADAGASWETVVDTAAAAQCFGIENLAGIPGTMGGAVVQNIGAYGTELAQVFMYADAIDARDGTERRITVADAAFGYRTSQFKTDRNLIIIRAALRVSQQGHPHLAYADLARAATSGMLMDTPANVVSSVRTIRAQKFPNLREEGTAGSFFKNPVLSKETGDELTARYPELPVYLHDEQRVKIPLAWILDHILSLKGYALGKARLFEKQPLVLVSQFGTSSHDVEALAAYVAKKVHDTCGITIEREVETLQA